MTAKTKRTPSPHPAEVEPVPDARRPAADEAGAAPPAWLTVETGLYALIFITAVALRLGGLGIYPLSDSEAAQSLVAWRLYHGDEAFTGSYYSPLLASLNTLSFLLFGDSNASARLASVLLGSGLVILPWTLRRQLGAPVCLSAAALLAISPTALYFSRTLNSEIGAAAGALMIAAGFFNWTMEGRRWGLFLLAAGLAALLTAGPPAYSILVVFSLIILFKLSDFKSLWRRGLYLTANTEERSEVPVDQRGAFDTALSKQRGADSVYRIRNPVVEASGQAGHNPAVSPEGQAAGHSKPAASSGDETAATQAEAERAAGRPEPGHSLTASQKSILQKAGLTFLVMTALLATAALFNLNGFSLPAASVEEWLGNFTFQADGGAGFNAVFLLTIYEPLLVFAGLVGLTLIILRGNFIAALFVGWFVGLLLLDIAMIGRSNSNIILVVTPLAFLAGFALAELWQSVWDAASLSNEGLLLATGLVIAAFGYIGLTGWLERTCGSAELACQYAWLQTVAALFLFLIIVVFFAVMNDPGAALRGAALTAVALGLLSVISIGWRLNYGALTDLAYQPLTGRPPSPELVVLTETLADQSARRVGDETLLDVTVTGVESPALQWRLRHYQYLTTGGVLQTDPPAAIITPETTDLGLGQGYIGQDFTLEALWSPVGLPPKDLINWLVYRKAAAPPQGSKAVLWLRVGEEEEVTDVGR